MSFGLAMNVETNKSSTAKTASSRNEIARATFNLLSTKIKVDSLLRTIRQTRQRYRNTINSSSTRPSTTISFLHISRPIIRSSMYINTRKFITRAMDPNTGRSSINTLYQNQAIPTSTFLLPKDRSSHAGIANKRILDPIRGIILRTSSPTVQLIILDGATEPIRLTLKLIHHLHIPSQSQRVL